MRLTQKRLALAAALVALISLGALVGAKLGLQPAADSVVQGVRFPARVEIDGHSLRLIGAGARRVMMFTPYAAALYLEHETHDASEVLHDEQIKHVHLHLLADLDRRQIEWSFRSAVERNNPKRSPELRAQLDALYAALRDAKRGEDIRIAYLPQSGTRFSTGKDEVPRMPGKELGAALMSIWFGPLAVDADLKAAMLGLVPMTP